MLNWKQTRLDARLSTAANRDVTSAESWTSGVPGKKLEGTQSGGFGALDAARTLSIVHQTLRRQRLYRGNNIRHIGTNEELGEQLIEHIVTWRWIAVASLRHRK